MGILGIRESVALSQPVGEIVRKGLQHGTRHDAKFFASERRFDTLRTLEDIFHIVIVVFVQAEHGDSLSVSSQLPSHIAVFAAV